MNKNYNYGAIVSIVLAMMLVIGGGFYYNADGNFKDKLDEKDNIISDKDTELSKLAGEISSLSQSIVDVVDDTSAVVPGVTDEVVDEVIEIIERIGYLIDEMDLNGTLNENFTDRELNLFDGKIEFDGEDYNMDEYVNVQNIQLTTNEDDFDANVYAVISEDSIKYTVKFDDLILSEIGNETLEFNFLGEKIEIVKWNGDVTFKRADEIVVAEGDSITVDGTTVLLDIVMEDSVYVTVNGQSKKIYEGDSKQVGGIEVYVESVLYRDLNSKAVLAVGDEVEETIENGDEYNDLWDWTVNNSDRTIGITLSEDFEDLDDENKPLAYGETICLPNDFVCIEFGQLSVEETSEYEFDYDESKDELEITGDFEYGNEDVDKVYIELNDSVNATNIVMYYEDEDKDRVYITNFEIDLKDSDQVLKYNETSEEITMEGLVLPRNMTQIVIDGDDFNDKGMYRSVYGSIVDVEGDLEADEDNKLTVSVPEEKIEANFLVY